VDQIAVNSCWKIPWRP